TTINIPDTVGYTMPFEFAGIISGLYERVPNIDKAIISVHTHDDLGLAVGNSLAAVHAGARQVEGAMMSQRIIRVESAKNGSITAVDA
ncbi:hypothetical protein ACUOCP_52890, partial [Escherichia sp. R-CC3]